MQTMRIRTEPRTFTTSTVYMTSRFEKTQRVVDAGSQLFAAGFIVALIAGMALAVVILKLRYDHADETPAETDLTYRLPKPNATATTTATSVPTTTEDLETEPTTKETTSTSTGTTREILDRQTLFCTYGTRTVKGTMFPDDGLCDLVYFDSIYKWNQNLLSQPQRFSENLLAFLEKTATYQQTEVGVAFAYEKVANLRADLNKSNAQPLDTFWKRGVRNFGIIDMPAFGVKASDISKVFLALRELSTEANKKPSLIKPPHIVLGALPFKLEDYYGNKIRDVQDPTLFITQSHYSFGDNEVPDCTVLPPTLLLKPQGSQSYYYDLSDAALALRRMQIVAGSVQWLVSVGMKGRWTKVKPDAPLHMGSPCEHDARALSFGSYAQVCKDKALRPHLHYDPSYEAVGTRDSSRNMFVYDNEEGLCRKLCSLKFQNKANRALRFGVAVYDLDYEDDRNACTDLNKFGAFSRLKMVRRVVDYYGSLPADGSDCVDAVPCVLRAG
ncbi:uncharacterized protein LOC144101686 [Amblyomma americanum]